MVLLLQIQPALYNTTLAHLLHMYITDLPEQQLIACISKNAFPITTAELSDFGDDTPYPPRTAESTLCQIFQLCNHMDPWDLPRFQKAAKGVKLLGIRQPFFRHWRFADPARFLNGEILHTCHNFLFNHILTWCKKAAGNHLLDSCYKQQHKRVGVRYFASGVSHMKQMTGREPITTLKELLFPS